MCLVVASYKNEPNKSRYTNGFTFIFSEGTVLYSSKTRSINAFSSTEAKLISAVTDSKTVRVSISMLRELGFHQDSPTPINEENYPTIDIVNSSIPTEIIRHNGVRFFAIQGWK